MGIHRIQLIRLWIHLIDINKFDKQSGKWCYYRRKMFFLAKLLRINVQMTIKHQNN